MVDICKQHYISPEVAVSAVPALMRPVCLSGGNEDYTVSDYDWGDGTE